MPKMKSHSGTKKRLKRTGSENFLDLQHFKFTWKATSHQNKTVKQEEMKP
jgi:ribosomal protein L35